MAFINLKLFSDSLNKATEVNIIIPENNRGRVPVLYLLHGLSGDHGIWMRMTSIERYAEKMGIAVVMPDGDRSFYTDMQNGANYQQYISEELRRKICSMLSISNKRDENFIAGLSMGGYGAYKISLSNPQKYCFAASLSGGLDICKLVESPRNICSKKEFEVIFGDLDNLSASSHDLFRLVDKNLNEGREMPYLYQCCGTEDELRESNIEFRDYLIKKGVKVEYEEGPGIHDWYYWDAMIQKVLLKIEAILK